MNIRAQARKQVVHGSTGRIGDLGTVETLQAASHEALNAQSRDAE